MKRLIVLVALLASTAQAAGVQRPTHDETILMTRTLAAALSNAGATYTGMVVKEPIKIERVTFMVIVNSGGGAGTSVLRVSDGTNHCDCTFACTATSSGANSPAGAKEATCSGACSPAPGTTLSLIGQASTCTATQPSVAVIDVRGRRI